VEKIRAEQHAFNKLRDRLIQDGQGGRFVLVSDGAVVQIFDDAGAAHAAGFSRFGSEGVFLVAPIEQPRPITTSWSLGVMFS